MRLGRKTGGKEGGGGMGGGRGRAEIRVGTVMAESGQIRGLLSTGGCNIG